MAQAIFASMSTRDLEKADPGPPPVPPSPASATHTSQLKQINRLKDSLDQHIGHSVTLLRELNARLNEHEAQLRACCGQQPGQPQEPPLPTNEGPPMRSTSTWRSRQPSGLVLGSPSEDASRIDGMNTPKFSARSEPSPSFSEASLVGCKRPRSCRSLDVAALEVCQGWRRKLPDDFGDGAISARKSHWWSVRPETPDVLDTASCILVTVNLFFMMAEVEVDMQSALRGRASPEWIWYLNICLTVLFVLEILLRIWLEGTRNFAFGRNWRWNAFDVFAVSAQVVDVVLTVVSIGFLRVIRMLRMIRAARIIKTARYVRDLRLMIAALAASLPSLLWAVVLVILTILLYAMFIMQVARGYISDKGVSNVNPDLVEYYGSLPKSVLSLFIAVTGGKDWMDFVEPLREISGFYLISFAVFMVFVLLGMLNILTAVFVESTNKIAEIDADLVIMEQLDRESSALNKMKSLLQTTDMSGSGTISIAEFDEKLRDPVFKAEMQLMELHMHEAKATFHLLDADRSGEVDIDEMIHGLMRLKGTAKALDQAEMLFESKRVHASIKRLAEVTECNFRDLKFAMQQAVVSPRTPGAGEKVLREVCREIADLDVWKTSPASSQAIAAAKTDDI